MTMYSTGDNRRVALIKSLTTNNRFYTLVHPDRGIRNADAIKEIPGDLMLGIAYPCLEDGLNDFAVIRTTFETLDLFPEDDPIRGEMMEIINDARSNLTRRLAELRERLHAQRAHFLGTDYTEFKTYALDMVHRGYPRRNLDSMMKLNVFSSVAESEGHTDASELLYNYEFYPGTNAAQTAELPAREFVVHLFDDLLASVLDDSYYHNKYLFDRNVFQKFIAVMFVNYATTDPMFYGINKSDYGVSADKEMDNTPLYIAIGRELREIEKRLGVNNGYSEAPAVIPIPNPLPMPSSGIVEAISSSEPDFSLAAELPGSPALEEPHDGRRALEAHAAQMPGGLIQDEILLGPISSLCSAASLLMRKSDPETQRFARVILHDASILVEELKRLGIISSLAGDPGSGNY